MPPRFSPHRPSLRPSPQTLQRPRPHFRLLAVQRFGHRSPHKAKPYLCIVKTKPPFAATLPQTLRPIAHLPKHPARRSTTHPLISPNRPRLSLKPTPPLPETHPLLPHRPTSLIPFTAMFHTALIALTAFYRTTVVILPLGHHRTLHLHTLPALLLIPYLAQLN